MNPESKNLQNIIQNFKPEDNYFYDSKNLTEIDKKDNSIEQNSRNAEPQDNIKKSKRRRLLEMERNLKLKVDQNNGGNNSIIYIKEVKDNMKEELIKNSFDDDNDNKSLTEIKTNRINKIFRRELNQNDINSESNIIQTNIFNNNLKIANQNNIYNNKEKLSKMNYQNNNLVNFISKNNYENILSSPKILRKSNLSLINNIDINNMTNRLNIFDEKYYYKFNDQNEDIFEFENNNENKKLYNNNSNTEINYKRIKSLNHNSQNIHNNYKRLNSARNIMQNISIQSTSSGNNNEIKFNNINEFEDLNTKEKVPMDNTKRRNKKGNNIKQIKIKKDDDSGKINKDNNQKNLSNKEIQIIPKNENEDIKIKDNSNNEIDKEKVEEKENNLKENMKNNELVKEYIIDKEKKAKYNDMKEIIKIDSNEDIENNNIVVKDIKYIKNKETDFGNSNEYDNNIIKDIFNISGNGSKFNVNDDKMKDIKRTKEEMSEDLHDNKYNINEKDIKDYQNIEDNNLKKYDIIINENYDENLNKKGDCIIDDANNKNENKEQNEKDEIKKRNDNLKDNSKNEFREKIVENNIHQNIDNKDGKNLKQNSIIEKSIEKIKKFENKKNENEKINKTIEESNNIKEDIKIDNSHDIKQNISILDNNIIGKEEIKNIEKYDIKKAHKLNTDRSKTKKKLVKSYSRQNINEKNHDKFNQSINFSNIFTRNDKKNLTNISEKNYEIKNKKSQTIYHNEEISHDINIKYKLENKNNKINNANKIKILYKNPKKIKEKIFSNNTFKTQSKENKQKSPYKKNNPTKNIKTQSSKNNMVFSSSNIKNTHKIISRKKGISSSTKSLDIANHYIYNTQNNNSNCIKTIKKKKENFKKMEKRNDIIIKEENIKSKKNIDIN